VFGKGENGVLSAAVLSGFWVFNASERYVWIQGLAHELALVALLYGWHAYQAYDFFDWLLL
jgi:hypothetical protein